MPWVVTLHVTQCGSPTTNLAGAVITDGTNYYSTDVNGRFIAIVSDAFTGYVIQISKPNYSPLTYALSVTQNGTTQEVCLNVAPPTPPSTGGGGCFIVSAATGSTDSEEISQLRQLRDQVGSVSRLGAELIDVIYAEYYEFSPAIAAEVEADAFTQQAVLRMIVRPLLAWYSLAGTLAFDCADEEAVQRAANDVAKACPIFLGGPAIVSVLEAIRGNQPLPPDTPQLLLEFAPKIQQAASYRGASWAILDPLLRAWKTAIDGLDVVEQVSQWMANAPLESLTQPVSEESLEAELVVLRDFFRFRPDAMQDLGARLTVAWPNTAVSLARHGFI